MKPLEARTPAELFGEAAEDPTQLKRAYARLIRAHGPESDPEAFEHIRRLYEQAQAELKAPKPAPEREEPPGASWADALLAGAREDKLDELADRLLARALQTGDPESLSAALGIDRCRDLARFPDRLLAAAANPALQPRVVGHVVHLFSFAAALVDHPAWDALNETLVEPRARLYLLMSRARVLCQKGRRAEAWGLFRAREAWLRSLPEAEWLPAAIELLSRCAWVVPEAEARAWASRLGEVVPEDLEAACARTEALLIRVLSARQEVGADRDPLATLPERLHDEHPAVAIAVLLEILHRPGAMEALQRRLAERPAWTCAFWAEVQRLTETEESLWRWQASGKPPIAPLPWLAARVQAWREEQVSGGEEAERLEKRVKRMRSALMLTVAFSLVPILSLVSFQSSDLELGLTMGAWMLGYFAAILLFERFIGRPTLARARALREESADASPLLRLARDLGLWLPELAAQAPAETAMDSLLLDLPATLSAVGDEHIRRAFHPRESPA